MTIGTNRPLLLATVLAFAAALAFADADARTAPADYTFGYDVDAPVERVWDLLTTEEGLESWAVPACEADFRPGGSLKTHYGAGAIGDENTIVHHIDAVVPFEMYAARTTPPANGGIMKLLAGTHSVTTFERVLPDRTRVTYRSFGWGEGAQWDALRKVFDSGNAWTLERLRQVVPPRDRATEARETLAALASLGGHWLGTARAPGGEGMRVHTHVRSGPGGHGVVMQGRIRDGEETWLHSSTHVWVAPRELAVRFHEISDDGGAAHGTIDLETGGERRTLVWDRTHVAPTGVETRTRVEQELDGDAAYRMRLLRDDGRGGRTEAVVVEHRRVDGVPAGFASGD